MSEPPSGDAAERASKSYQTLQALQASEARFRLLVERNADGMVVVGLDGRIAYLNPAARVLLGRGRESLVGQPFGIPVVPGETTEIDLNTPVEVRHAEMRVVQTQWEGRSAFLVMLHDLTERERAAAALRQSEETFRLLVEGVRDYGLFLLDPDGRVASWNEGAERFLGYPSDEILGQPYARFFTPEDQSANVPQHELNRARREGRAGDERWHLRRDGSRFWASRVVSPLREDSGQIQGFVKIVHDMTERKELEEELRRRADDLAEADSQKNAFLAMLAHELRNPLAPIQNAVELLKDCSDERCSSGPGHDRAAGAAHDASGG